MNESKIEACPPRIVVSEQGVVSLEENDQELDLAMLQRLILPSSSGSNLKLEIKYPNYRKFLESHKNSEVESFKKYLKLVYLRVKPLENAQALSKAFESLNLCESLLGIYPNVAFDPVSNDHKVIVQGFRAKQLVYKSDQQLEIGDLLISVNEIEVNSENLEALLSAIRRPQTIKVVALSPVTYVNLNTNQIVLKKTNAENKLKNHATTKILAPSKSTQVVQGDRVKCTEHSDDIFYSVMILSLAGPADNNNNNNDHKNDLIYKYSSGENESNRQMLGAAELFLTIRGMFMTLACALKELGPSDEAVCCVIDHHEQLYNVCFLNGNYGPSGVCVLVVPFAQVDLNYLKVVAKNMNETLKFGFGDLMSRLKSGSEEINLKPQLDAFFAQLKSRFSSASTTNRPFSVLNNLVKIQSAKIEKSLGARRLIEMRSKFINKTPYLDLPFDLKADLDATLVEVEAQEFVDLENNFYKYRRNYSILGSCLFYKDYLISTHLNEQRTVQVYNYCEHYNLFKLVNSQNTSQFHIWKEVFFKQNQKNSRYFLIIIGLREFIYAMIIETGGKIARMISMDKAIEPDPFFVQQACFVLSDINDNGIMNEIERYFKQGQDQMVFNISRFVTSRKKPGFFKAISNGLSKSRSPIRSEVRNSKNTSPAKPKPNENLSNQVENYTPSTDSSYHSHKDQRHRSPSPQKRNSTLNRFQMENRHLSDVSLQDSIIYYASCEGNTGGIIFPPRKYDSDSPLFNQVFSNFIQSCFKIKNLFDNSYFHDFNKSDEQLIEQGVLFNIVIDESEPKRPESSAQNASKLKEINFWVVGRRKLKRLNSGWKDLGDFFICFHDVADQILVELAFDFAFAKFAI